MRHAFLAVLLLAGCARTPAVVPQPRYALGEGYRSGGIWSYPREEFELDESGIAAILPSAGPGLTANGELRDSRGMFAAHRTLQLPAIVTVTHLENGRSIRLRVNDRGPQMAGRVIGVTPRAAELLGARGPFRARVVIDGQASRAAMEGLSGQDVLPIQAAPVGRVEREGLAPPTGARGSAGPAAAATPVRDAEAPAAAREPERLPEQVVQGPVTYAGSIWLEAGRFFRRDLAQAQAARIGGRAEPFGPPGHQQQWRVRSGPYSTIPEADAALARALAAGQPDLRLAVE
ncbi:sporulation and cell division repeat protein [Roseococcus sp. SYP-B2431]|uniref:septal ring lytic transglycosylase RlpA family protein n=1 Tax=Roseococcus sp. SYP-B2431 TaxID=2496640 RepID=UPI00103EB813|nr:RlpA-like double-psi beta-barrel domain-containing protein [Roseococcus sp. SYP-B2431]TCH99864.1 sporulation and cell division repeat protein [Roseococcus sp. SYP-B2431]